MLAKIRMPSISFIVARSYPEGVIGCENKLPWKLKSDLQRFKRLTQGHAVIMGRKTFLSIGKPLPNRTNIVLSRETKFLNDDELGFKEETQLLWATTVEDAMYMADLFSIVREKQDFFVIGGAEIYRRFSPLVNTIYLTEVFAEIEGDAHFDDKFPRPVWKLIEESDFPKTDSDEYPHRFTVLRRRKRADRYAFVRDFFTETDAKAAWLANKIENDRVKILDYADKHLELFES